MNKKEVYKIHKKINGPLAPVTILFGIRKSPLLIFAYPFMILVHLIKEFFNYTLGMISNLFESIQIWSLAQKKQNKKISDIIKPIAIYLPQYHEIPENNKWWGEGFTEWTNVKKAQPLFEGHYQPHIPHSDVGYYDLSDVSVMKKQAEMAKEHGIYGFCFYYYHFENGKRLLEKPIDNYLKAKDIDFPFCFAWANENWTRVWDGGEKDIIMPQDYDEKNLLLMIEQMMPAFKDSRYIKVDNKPVLLVYRTELIPEIRKIVAKWRALAKQNGFDDLYLICIQNFKQEDPFSMGFDAAVEFAPQARKQAYCLPLVNVSKLSHISDPVILRYKNIIKTHLSFKGSVYPRYKCVCPAWDNTARKGKNSPRMIIGNTPKLFKSFYKNAVRRTLVNNKISQNGFIFINAWNEWGEGTHLEPDEKYGYTYLEIIKNIQNTEIEKLCIWRIQNDKF